MTEIPDHRHLVDAREWINRLPRDLAPQARVLARLLDCADADERIRAVSVVGSMARGGADELSDLDSRIWVADDAFESLLADLPAIARTVGEPLDILFETPGSPFLFVHYVEGVQLELLACRASEATGAVSGELVLLDRDDRLRGVEETPAPWDVDLWLGWAWMRLYDLDKYLRRGVLWRALIKLEEARSLLLRHHAAATGCPEPQLGLISILNAHGTLPARLEETVAGLDAVDLRRAAHVCAELLAVYEQRPFGELVRARLAAQRSECAPAGTLTRGPMEPRIHVLTLAVSDLERALAFYRDGLGLESTGVVGTEYPGDHDTPAGAVAMFHLDGDLILALYPRTELAKDATVPLGEPKTGEFSIGHIVESKTDVDRLLSRAEAAGATLTDQPHDRPWGIYSGYFRDPDGHLWEIIWNPAP